MKKYFEYYFDNKIKEKLINYYENTFIQQHSIQQNLKMKVKLNRIKKLLSFSNEDIVLDVGCSQGQLLGLIQGNIKKYVGLDVSKSLIEKNKKKQKSNIIFLNFDGKNINLEDKFDKIFAIDVLEHAFEPNVLIKSINKSLKKSGYFILEVPFSGWLSELLTRKYHQGHLRYYDPNYLVKYLKQNGFSIENIKVYNSVPLSSFFLKFKAVWVLFDFLINLIPSFLYPYFGEIIVIAKKND
jgi:2-polyprenyl-3-methyl-5-hydroxy-6-metoxy-1,4-benzoquinol methylase